MRRVPDCADEDEMVTMRPHPASSMSGTAACRQWNVPVRLTATMRSHCSAVMSRKVAEPFDPGAGDHDLHPAEARADLVQRGVDGPAVAHVDLRCRRR